MEYLRCCQAVDILCLSVCLDQFLVPGHMREYSKFDLRVVCIQKYKTIFRHKNFADQPSEFHSDRNVLKVRFRTADTSRRCDRLVKGRMDPSIRFDHGTQSVCISGFEFRKLAVFQDIFDDFMFRCKFLKDICGCRITCFCLLAARDPHFFEQDHTELFRGVDVEFFSCLLPDHFFQFLDADA